MKLSVDEKNRRVIATGSWKGKRVKAIAVCSPEDIFDAEKGKQIAILKYKTKELQAKKAIHFSNIKALEQHIEWANHVLQDERNIYNNMLLRLSKLEKENNKKIEEIVK